MSNTLCILAIETSCDDTSIAITKNEKLLSNVTVSSLLQHRQYGGIVPEVAARSHEQNLHSVLNKALVKAKIKLNDITHIAYTSEPGLPGSLHVGKIFAKALAYLLSIPLIPVNHMIGHIFSFTINSKKKISFPFISLVVSGGHTAIYYFDNLHQSKLLNETKDDAVGETLDKIGRTLNLKYPGGISIDEIYESKKALLKLINHFSPGDNFSFSGLKTHITNLINQTKMQSKKIDRVTIASSSLKWIIDELITKINYYTKEHKCRNLVVGGGVSANKLLRKEINSLPVHVHLPIALYSGDNAAMIANYAYLQLTSK